MMFKFIINLLNRRFNQGLDEAAKRANKLYAQKGDSVVCHYCGKLMPKSEAGVVYDIEEDKMEYSHEECFQRNEPHGEGPIRPKEG